MAESGTCELKFDDQNDWIFADWIGRPSADIVKEKGNEMLEMMKQHKTTKVLNSNAKISGSWSAASEWTAEVWFPKMVAAGLKYFAWVQSPSTLSNLAAQRSKDAESGSDIIKFFPSVDEAASWLKSV